MAQQTVVPHIQVAIVGSGFSGLGAGIHLKREGIEDFLIFERAHDVGGTWRDNSYPGCACDVESQLYSFSFAPNPTWSHSFSGQAEIYAYLRKVAEEYGVRSHVRFNHDLLDARWSEDAQRWLIETSQGRFSANFLISGMGALADPKLPNIPGVASFKGKMFHSAQWDHDHDLHGKRVAVIGTGASAIQFVPAIQPKVASLKLFQRTPAWVLPRVDRTISKLEQKLYEKLPIAQKALRTLTFLRRETYMGLFRNPALMRMSQRLVVKHLEHQIQDPTLRAKLMPTYTMGCKRLLLSNDYYPALAQPNVDVITDGVREIREHSIVTTDGVEHMVDTIILGTGFHVTDMPFTTKVHGRDGRSLAQVWNGSPQAHLGTMVAGYPNFFTLLGPNTGLGHTSIVLMTESQLQLVTNALRELKRSDKATIEPLPEAQARYNDWVQARLSPTVWNQGGCASWYIDENGRNSTLWPDTTIAFQRITAKLRLTDYAFGNRRAEKTKDNVTNLHAA